MLNIGGRTAPVTETALGGAPLEHRREDPVGAHAGLAFATTVPCFVFGMRKRGHDPDSGDNG